MFELRLPGDTVHHRIDQRPHPRLGRIAVIPVHWDEHGTACNLTTTAHSHDHRSPTGGHPRQFPIASRGQQGILRMHINKGFRQILGKPGRAAGARHCVPLIPDSAGIEHKREFVTCGVRRSSWRRFDEPGSPIGMHEAAVLEQAFGAAHMRLRNGPLHGFELLVPRRAEARET